jgi:hypothetical protein
LSRRDAKARREEGSGGKVDGRNWEDSAGFIANDGGWPVQDETGICLLAIAEILQQFLHIIPVFGYDGPLVAVNLGDHRVRACF